MVVEPIGYALPTFASDSLLPSRPLAGFASILRNSLLAKLSKPAFTPSVAVNSRGTVAVTYYDFRNPDGSTVGQPTDYWFTSSTNNGSSFGNETRITPKSFDILNAPNAGGLFLGAYEGLDAAGTAFVPFFVQTNSGNTSNRTDVFTTTV